MEREVLEQWVAEGLSLSEMGARANRHPSTIGYWLRKHDLITARAHKYARRGAPDRDVLAALVEQGRSLRELSEVFNCSTSTVRHWLRRYGLTTEKARWRADPAERPAEIVRTCRTHGRGRFVRTGSKRHYRCASCRAEHVARRRRVVKEILVREAGGRCDLCGYDRSPVALQFHHVDPVAKEFGLAEGGYSRSLVRARSEAAKCVLLCANCHAEVEAAIVTLPDRPIRRSSTPKVR